MFSCEDVISKKITSDSLLMHSSILKHTKYLNIKVDQRFVLKEIYAKHN